MTATNGAVIKQRRRSSISYVAPHSIDSQQPDSTTIATSMANKIPHVNLSPFSSSSHTCSPHAPQASHGRGYGGYTLGAQVYVRLKEGRSRSPLSGHSMCVEKRYHMHRLPAPSSSKFWCLMRPHHHAPRLTTELPLSLIDSISSHRSTSLCTHTKHAREYQCPL